MTAESQTRAAHPPGSRTVRVPLGDRSYDIRIVHGDESGGFGPFAREALEATRAGRSCRSALVVTDSNVRALAARHAEALAAQGIAAEVAVVPPGEGSKSLEQAAELLDRLIALRADRHSAVVAVGGGVVGDLAGFVASTYARGIPLLMAPTTLLAQVDSSVGGKVGVNRPAAKNIVGAFHQPSGVWIDTRSLDTLPPRELRCGMAEVVKYGVILDPAFFEAVERAAAAVLALDPAAVAPVVARCCELKAGVVSEDEREETGLRAVLNFGHTIGHAVEAVAGYGGPFQHGEAVAAGMVAESRLAERLGWIDPGLTDRLSRLLRLLGLPTSAPGLDPRALIAAMTLDKKNAGGRIRFVLPRALGSVELTDAPAEGDVRAVLDELTAAD
ncbi:3-dehydroquinate synthase [Tautonia plasticadhaerens]|uniref:3-dehydroquinate synthase n=1 Tax=Tautonia plasticadhaerens TaxID=2527974 RepID=A0A518HCZ8_9BACT|nr:3-dehydroquinate synthase [Tautonia plasticadhaerens]QDV38737.1 3-dehydroquinate synthase [Tautonia plasticadhaerens]